MGSNSLPLRRDTFSSCVNCLRSLSISAFAISLKASSTPARSVFLITMVILCLFCEKITSGDKMCKKNFPSKGPWASYVICKTPWVTSVGCECNSRPISHGHCRNPSPSRIVVHWHHHSLHLVDRDDCTVTSQTRFLNCLGISPSPFLRFSVSVPPIFGAHTDPGLPPTVVVSPYPHKFLLQVRWGLANWGKLRVSGDEGVICSRQDTGFYWPTIIPLTHFVPELTVQSVRIRKVQWHP